MLRYLASVSNMAFGLKQHFCWIGFHLSLYLEALECLLARKLGVLEAWKLVSKEAGMHRSNNQEHVFLAGGAGARGDRRGVLEGQIDFTVRFS